LRLRARLLQQTRAFFAVRNILEVDTPALSSAAVSDPNIHSFSTVYHGPGPRYGQTLYLHTSPEFPMKRLLAAGSGSIYQIAKVFRDGEAGHRHNPEFCLLEWYRVDFDHHQLMAEVAELLSELFAAYLPLQAPQYLSYGAAFRQFLQLDPHRASVAELSACALQQGLDAPATMSQSSPDPWLDLLLSHCIEPRLPSDRLVFLYDYPVAQAALAKIRADQTPVAERFEVYLNGLELANGFHELNDASQQRRRFIHDNQQREQHGLASMPVDEKLLAVLDKMPDCAGVAIGLDRVLMLAAGVGSIEQVIPIPFAQA